MGPGNLPPAFSCVPCSPPLSPSFLTPFSNLQTFDLQARPAVWSEPVGVDRVGARRVALRMSDEARDDDVTLVNRDTAQAQEEQARVEGKGGGNKGAKRTTPTQPLPRTRQVRPLIFVPRSQSTVHCVRAWY